MKHLNRFLCASASLVALAAPAGAQTAPAAAPETAAVDQSNDIVVSARRREERLLDVPKTVNAVTSDDLRKNEIQKFEDIAAIVPGITLQNSGNGLVQNATIRGVSFDVDSGLPNPTVQFYLNDANIQPNWVFQSLYDIGQIEVLRGPQGTLRGRSAPSGSITVTTRKPDLYKWGGFVDETAETGNGERKETGALNVPIIKGKLAVRLAATMDDNENNAVHTVNPALYPTRPFNRTWGERASVRAEPIDTIEINVVYQHLVNRSQDNLQTESICLIDPSQPCGSGPVINAGDRLSTVNGQRFVYQNEDIYNGRFDWHVLGQKLSYVGQYALQHLSDEEPQDGADWFNSAANNTPPNSFFAGVANPYQKIAVVRSQFQSHEIRLANESRIANIFDYVVGYNTVDEETDVAVQTGGDYPHSVLPGVLAATVAGFPPSDIGRNGSIEISYFGNVTAHPTAKLEISGGARYIIDKQTNEPGPFYTNILGQTNSLVRASHTIWTASASYHFAPDLMGYVNAGSSFRNGAINAGLEDQPESYGAAPLTALPQFYNIKPETSTSYEVGVKSQWFNHRLTVDLDYYHQDFHNFQYISPDYIFFLDTNGSRSFLIPPVALGTENVPAKVDGVEGDFNYRFAQDGYFGGSFSYADGRITGNTQVPCTGNIAALQAAAGANSNIIVNTCPGGPTSNTPRFSASLHSDYAHRLTDRITGVVRGQLSYFGASPNNPAASPYDKQNAYALLNLYAGIRAPDSAWELTLFVKNVTNNATRLQTYGGNINASTGEGVPAGYGGPFGPPNAGGPIFSNYAYITTPPPREFGVTLHYAFGSR